MNSRTTLGAVLSCAAVAFAAQGRDLSHYDAVADSAPRARAFASPPQHLREVVRQDAPLHTDARLGLPTFVWAAPQAGSARRAAAMRRDAPEAARGHLADVGHLYGLSAAETLAAELAGVHDTGDGVIIARFRQSVEGVPVFRDELRIAMDRDLQPIAVAGYLSPDAEALRGQPIRFQLEAPDAITRALDDLRGLSISPADLDDGTAREGGYVAFMPRGALPGDTVLRSAIRTRRVLFHLPDHLEPAHYLELHLGSRATGATEYWSYVYSAVDGRLLFRNDLTAHDAFTYRVWADTTPPYIPFDGPQGNSVAPRINPDPDTVQPPFVSPNDVTLENSPFSRSATDPWLAAGATQTSGNNVDAYADIASPDGFNGADFRATVTAPGEFKRTYDTAQAPGATRDQQQAAITQLFYNVNFFHDWYYDAGFKEVDGNGQLSNYGRGGIQGDPVVAQAQDFSGFENANMSTPADGASPRMQMYIFRTPSRVNITAPAAILGTYFAGTAQFGPQAFDLTRQFVLALNGGLAIGDGCTALTNGLEVSGKIAVIVRGTCTFVEKVKFAQEAGADGVVITNNEAGLLNMAGDDPSVTIPSVILTLADGQRIRNQLPFGVTGRLARSVDRDGTVDNQVIAHEWGHYLSNRLISDANGLNAKISRGLGEGWADFHAMLMTVRAEDALVTANAGWNGVYALAGYASYAFIEDNFYFGIRRVPYSTAVEKDPLTFKHITDGVALPNNGAPISFGADGVDNSEVHNTGEVWATMLWECYAALLRAAPGGGGPQRFASFDAAREQMKRYIVAHYKIMPPNPTLLEARDALLAVASTTPADYQDFLTAFAKRGAGTRAVAPDRYMPDNSGLVEDFTGGSGADANDVQLVFAVVDGGAAPACAADADLDAGETGMLTVAIRNVGANALPTVSGTVTSSNAAVTFPSGNTLTFNSVGPRVDPPSSVQIPIHLDAAAAGAQTLNLTIQLTAGGIPTPYQVVVANRVNIDAVPNQSATDDVEAVTTTWTPAGEMDPVNFDISEQWRRVARSGVDHRWYMPAPAIFADQWLISPRLQASAGPMTLTFNHRHFYSPLQTSTGNLVIDGGVVEVSTDDGATWADVTRFASFSYPGRILSDPDVILSGRAAFTLKNPAWPNQDTVSIAFLDLLAGKPFKVRFRAGLVGTSQNHAFGWEIDDIGFTGLANLPFAKLVGRAGTVCNRAPVANAGPGAAVQIGDSVHLDGRGSSDPDGDPISYRWVQQSGAKATLDNPAGAQPNFAAPKVQSTQELVFVLFVDDGKLTSVAATVTVTVQHTNAAPVANAGANQIVAAASLVTLDGSASADPEGYPITYKWTQTGGTAVTLSDPSAARPTFTAPPGGEMTFQLVVNDGLADSGAATTKVSIKGSGGGCGCSSGATSDLFLFAFPLLAFALRRRR